jgi:O-antigen ligase
MQEHIRDLCECVRRTLLALSFLSLCIFLCVSCFLKSTTVVDQTNECAYIPLCAFLPFSRRAFFRALAAFLKSTLGMDQASECDDA